MPNKTLERTRWRAPLSFDVGWLAMRRVCLYNLDQAALIVLEKTGVVYFNQCGGNACNERQAEGFLIPLSNDPPLVDLHKGALDYILSDLCVVGEVIRQAVPEMNAAIAKCITTDQITIDGARLRDSEEAWVYVKVVPEGPHSLHEGFDTYDAILTWSNSD